VIPSHLPFPRKHTAIRFGINEVTVRVLFRLLALLEVGHCA
jgi:hypothetical protein